MTNPNETPDLGPMAENLIRNEAPNEALEALLAELEETAEELRGELAARGHSTEALAGSNAAAAEQDGAGKPKKMVNPNVTPEQQAELDENFARYWSNSQGSWKNLFRLLREFRAEMKEGKKDD
ncbi:hypothetical protein [Corynebacterium timonense]|uniref:Uncharacterized protein n=1 Tax=Corynebacterium timonense TaxID=441500 RepID=A0A1H1L501_9CORY|nr:hypothetical protein [Corynebacterium timonense]SDR69638.1 hypothetical protein SAMN04488539_0067 [Corynebacterium timonense]